MTRKRGASVLSPWLTGSVLTSLLVLIPVAVVLSSIFQDSGGAWSHLVETRLSDYALNTLLLTISVCAVTACIGIPTAWLVTMHEFPGRKVLSWALLLPLAVPAYLSAYAMTDFLQVSGPVQSWLRATADLDVGDYWFPDLRSLPGAAAILGFSLYPYVYFAARTAFIEQSQSLLEASRTLGRSPLRTFITVALPLARPALAAATILVMLETVADFGAVEHCAVDTFATGVYRTWLGLDSLEAASQLSSLMLALLIGLIVAGVLLRRNSRVHRTTARCTSLRRTRITGGGAIIATTVCVIPLLVGFALPFARFVYLSLSSGDARAGELLVTLAGNTFFLAAVSGVLSVVIAVLVTYTARLRRDTVGSSLVEVCRAGYAIPGPVIAISVLAALGWIDHRINSASATLFSDLEPPGLLLTGTVVAMLIGYQTRFLAVAIAPIYTGFARANVHLDDAARTLGSRPFATLLRVHIPSMHASLLAAGLLVFVDVAKELPATLMLRPFNFDTLAVRVYQLASDERLAEASTSAIGIIAVGIIPIFILHRFIERQHSTLKAGT